MKHRVALVALGIFLQSPIAAAEQFGPTWESLAQYECPEWFRDAKFGIWAVWGPQCEPEAGDWYARNMYIEGHRQYLSHLKHYGHPSEVGFKDIIHQWKGENFDPDALLALYKKAGARYFMAMANHHDNLDLYDSKHQPWNSVAVGPKKDIIGLFAKAARDHGLRFGVSVHASHAWSWYEPAQGADKEGEFADIPYDGGVRKEDGTGKWWEGLDPQVLYAQDHSSGDKLEWEWNPEKGSSVPDKNYMENFFLRTLQLWDDYQPDQIYFDDTVLPFHGITDDIGLKLAAHFYNSSIERHGSNEAVMNTKKLNEQQRKALVYDIERGKAEGIMREPWQTDTCLGHWHYDRSVYENHTYKDASVIIPMLADIVSKNGNLMLSVPIRGDGTLDGDEIRILAEIGEWLEINGEAIYETRPWRTYGEGPSTTFSEKGHFDGQADTTSNPFTSEDIRFTRSKDGSVLYAIALAIPQNRKVTIKSLAIENSQKTSVSTVGLLGHTGKLAWSRDKAGLHIKLPATLPSDHAATINLIIKDS